MSERCGALRWALAGALAAGAALAAAGGASADPADPAPAPVTTVPVPPPPPQADAMTPNQQALPPADPAAPPPPPPPSGSRIPPVPNQVYGSGQYGGGVLGTLRDLWHQAQNPFMTQEELLGAGGAPTPPPGAGPAPALPPGYVSTNAPGSETPSSGSPAGPATGRPALPPGYYPIDGPPPPGYEFTVPPGVGPIAAP